MPHEINIAPAKAEKDVMLFPYRESLTFSCAQGFEEGESGLLLQVDRAEKRVCRLHLRGLSLCGDSDPAGLPVCIWE